MRVKTSAIAVSPGRVEILLAGLARAQRGVQGIEDGRLAGIERLGSLALFLKVDQDFVSRSEWR